MVNIDGILHSLIVNIIYIMRSNVYPVEREIRLCSHSTPFS